MSLVEVILYTLSSFFGGAVSAITGMGGGVFLFSMMTFTLPITTIVPVHGLVQLFSNLSRIFWLRDNLVLRMVLAFALGLPFGVILAVYVIKSLSNPEALLFLIALLILLNVFKPKNIKLPTMHFKGFIVVGFISGVLGIFVGTVGPFISLFFLRDDLKKEQIVATKSAMQMMVHITKVPTFLYLGFAYMDYMWPILIMIGAAIIGNKIGINILRGISEKSFRFIFKSILVISALRLIYNGVIAIIS